MEAALPEKNPNNVKSIALPPKACLESKSARKVLITVKINSDGITEKAHNSRAFLQAEAVADEFMQAYTAVKIINSHLIAFKKLFFMQYLHLSFKCIYMTKSE